MMPKHVFVVSEWLAKEGCEGKLWDCCKRIMSSTLKSEKGCVRAHATKQIPHRGSPGKSKYQIVLLQEYVNLEAFDLHCDADYVTGFFQKYVEDETSAIVEDWRCRLFSEE